MKSPPPDAARIDAILDGFEDASLPPSELSHAAHLVIACAYARRYGRGVVRPFEIALRRYLVVRAGNAAAYHQTMTIAWLRIVVAFCDAHHDRELSDVVARLLEQYPDKHGLDRHYSRERLLGARARERWIEPDRADLPDPGLDTADLAQDDRAADPA